MLSTALWPVAQEAAGAGALLLEMLRPTFMPGFDPGIQTLLGCLVKPGNEDDLNDCVAAPARSSSQC